MNNDVKVFYWKDYYSNSPNQFQQLWQDQDFTDVTLATEDYRQIKTHKVVLILFSNLFKSLFSRSSHQNHIVYLQGIKQKDLNKVLQFVYLGQCQVRHEDLQGFLATCVDLKVHGFIGPTRK